MSIMTLQLEITFDVDGNLPTAEQRDDLTAQIMEDWPNWVYKFGDSVATIEIVATWSKTK